MPETRGKTKRPEGAPKKAKRVVKRRFAPRHGGSAARQALPYRESSDCFILYRGKLIARAAVNENTQRPFIQAPGGGIDPGETPLQGARRECLEEVGAKLKSLQLVITVCWDWYPEWADTPKRKQRYAQFRGLNLTWEVRESIAKHVTTYDHPHLREFDPELFRAFIMLLGPGR